MSQSRLSWPTNAWLTGATASIGLTLAASLWVAIQLNYQALWYGFWGATLLLLAPVLWFAMYARLAIRPGASAYLRSASQLQERDSVTLLAGLLATGVQLLAVGPVKELIGVPAGPVADLLGVPLFAAEVLVVGLTIFTLMLARSATTARSQLTTDLLSAICLSGWLLPITALGLALPPAIQLGIAAILLGSVHASARDAVSRTDLRLRRSGLAKVAADIRGRRRERYLAAGLDLERADLIAGTMSPRDLDFPDAKVRFLVGTFGAGKSTAADRYLEKALALAEERLDAPIPVYELASADSASEIGASVLAQARLIGDPSVVGIDLVVDDVSRLSASEATRLISEIRAVVAHPPASRALVLTRTGANAASVLDDLHTVTAPPMSLAESRDLIKAAWDVDLSERDLDYVEAPILEALALPLFALLMGAYVAERGGSQPRSTGALLGFLVDRAISGLGDGALPSHFNRVAARWIDRGGPIPIAEAGSDAEVASLIASGLLARTARGIDFPVPLVAYWLGARSLGEGAPSVDALLADASRLERWRPALATTFAVLPTERVVPMLVDLASRRPGVAIRLLADAATFPVAEPGTLPPSLEAAALVRSSMEAWNRGFGPLGPLVTPTTTQGQLGRLLCDASDGRLTTVWDLEDTEPQLADLAGGLPAGRHAYRWGTPESHGGWPAAWAFATVADLLRSRLGRPLPAPDVPELASEALWRAAQDLTDKKGLFVEAISVSSIDEALREIADARFLSARGWIHDLSWVEENVRRLKEVGTRELRAPYPTADLRKGSGRTWSFYSKDRILELVTYQYRNALIGYTNYVDRWLPSLATDMPTRAMMPARLVGWLDLSRDEPDLVWLLVPLPSGQPSRVEISLGRREVDDDLFVMQADALRSLRANGPAWRASGVHASGPELGSAPALSLAHQWLLRDLRDIGIDRIPISAHW
jgi:hypothetical protein